jgi:DNA-binding PadR family transcriptional regulator
MTRHLGEFEQLLLFALIELGDDADGVKVRRLIEEKTARTASPGAIYTAMERLAGRGFVSAEIGDSTPARGGRRRKLYRIEPAGAEALQRSFTTLTQMAKGLTPRLAAMAGEDERGGGDR